MDAFIIIFLFKLLCSINVVLSRASISNANMMINSCSSAKCSTTTTTLQIQPPFRIHGLHPHSCATFTLFCTQNATTIHFPGHRYLFVTNISYDARRLSLADPNNCVHEVFLNLDLSHTPFRYYHTLHQYKYLNCSAKLHHYGIGGMLLEPVPCLSGSNHHVYVVDPSLSLPVSCSPIRTVAIPFPYSPYLSADSSFGLGLTWTSTSRPPKSNCSCCHKLLPILCYDHYMRGIYAVFSMIVFIFIVGKLVFVSKFNGEKDDGMLRDNNVETQKLIS